MKSVLICGLATAIPFHKTINRVIGNDISKEGIDKQHRQARTSSPFNFQLTCQDNISKATCSSVNQTLQNAGLKISQELLIVSPINVLVSFESFCAIMDTCNLLGGAVVASSYMAKTDNSEYFMYPQAIVRQTVNSMNFNNYDIIARFNSDFDWYFSILGDTIKGHQYDFEFVAIHELTHGLGFGSSLVEYNTGSNMKYLAPPLLLVNNRTYDGFQIVNSFDARIQSGNATFQNLSSELQTFKVQSENSSIILSDFETSPSFNVGRDFLLLATSPSLTFQTLDSKSIPLVTTNPFVQTTTISHITPDNFQSADYLMVPSFPAGVSLEYFMEKYGTIYGPKTISILTSIGWSTVTENHPKHLIVSSSAVKSSTITLLLPVIFYIY